MPLNSKPTWDRAVAKATEALKFRGLTRVLSAGWLLTALLAPVLAFSATQPNPYQLSLSWNASPSPDVVGYHLYYGGASGDYTNDLALGVTTTVTVSGLVSGVTYYFAIAAVGANGQESGLSNEISYRQAPPRAQLQNPVVAGGGFRLTLSGLVGQNYELEASTDCATWTAIGTLSVGDSGSLDFTDTNAATFSQRFYRTRETP